MVILVVIAYEKLGDIFNARNTVWDGNSFARGLITATRR